MIHFKVLPTFSFAEDSIDFQCRYGRTINVGTQITQPTPQPQPIIAQGSLSYTMDAQVGDHGGNTIVNIIANHNFNGITPT